MFGVGASACPLLVCVGIMSMPFGQAASLTKKQSSREVARFGRVLGCPARHGPSCAPPLACAEGDPWWAPGRSVSFAHSPEADPGLCSLGPRAIWVDPGRSSLGPFRRSAPRVSLSEARLACRPSGSTCRGRLSDSVPRPRPSSFVPPAVGSRGAVPAVPPSRPVDVRFSRKPFRWWFSEVSFCCRFCIEF